MLPIKVMRLRNAAGGGGGGSDPYWANVVSLLHFDGADGSTTFSDATGKTWTATGNAQIDTAQSKFGGASGLFDGSGDYVTSTISSAIGTGDFTVEAWIRVASLSADGEIFCISDPTFNTSKFNLVFEVKTSGSIRFSVQDGSGGTQIDLTTPTALISTGVWYHVAGTMSGTTGKIWIDGAQQASGTGTGTRVNGESSCRFGYLSPDFSGIVTRYFNGHIDDFRLTKGVARYTSNFTPPIAPFPDS